MQNVTVTRLSGEGAPQIESVLPLTAREMTTTDFSLARLRAAVSGYAFGGRLLAHTEFPHGVTIEVIAQPPLARLDVAGRMYAVSAATVLGGIVPSRELPLVRSAAVPLDGAVADPLAREELAILAAAPAPLLARVYSVALGDNGLT